MSLEGKTVVVTGAGRGIGVGIARCFLARGAKVVITDLDADAVAAAAAELGENATGMVADASSQEAMAECCSEVTAQQDSVDVLVNNAGIGGPKLGLTEFATDSAVETMSDEAWDEQLRVNLRTAYASSSAALPYLSDGGSIVNIASIAALSPTLDLPAYGAAKAGVVHLTKTLALQLAPRRIRVNCICPGLLWTRAWEMLATHYRAKNPGWTELSTREVFERVVAGSTPLGAEQTPEDIGNLAVFYASDEARMITGQVVAVDGGITLR